MSISSTSPQQPGATGIATPAAGESGGDTPRPATTTVHATWHGARRYEIRRPNGPALTIDADGEVGPGPVDTMLGALASCSAIDVVDYLAKRRTPAERLDVRVDAERRATPPRRVLSARLEFRLDGEGIEPAHAERAIALSIQTYCSVSASMAADLALDTVLVLNGRAFPAVSHRGVAA